MHPVTPSASRRPSRNPGPGFEGMIRNGVRAIGTRTVAEH
jgi:hypothetical protein